MSNWIKLPGGRLLNLALIVDIEYFDTANPYARLGLPAGATVGYAPELAWSAVSIDVTGDDARALMAHFDRQEVVRVAPPATPAAPLAPVGVSRADPAHPGAPRRLADVPF